MKNPLRVFEKDINKSCKDDFETIKTIFFMISLTYLLIGINGIICQKKFCLCILNKLYFGVG